MSVSWCKVREECHNEAKSFLKLSFPHKKSNKREGWNKRGWWANVIKSINEEDGINVEGWIFLENVEEVLKHNYVNGIKKGQRNVPRN